MFIEQAVGKEVNFFLLGENYVEAVFPRQNYTAALWLQ